MAIAVLGGLVTDALLNLFVLPGLYAARAWQQDTSTCQPPSRHRTDHELVTDGSTGSRHPRPPASEDFRRCTASPVGSQPAP